MYSPVLLDHFDAPRNVGDLPDASVSVEEENPVCGDRIHLALRVADGVIEDARWRGSGCAPAIAAASMVTELVRGLSVQEARQIDRHRIEAALGGLPARKSHAALLAASVLQCALASLVGG